MVNSGFTLTITNTAANTLNGTGRLQAQSATSIITFAAGANGGIVPGANIATGYVGRINTAGAMNLTGSLNMGATSVLNLGGNLTLDPTSQVTLGMSSVPTTALPGAGLLVGQPTTAGTPEIVLANGALTGQVPGVTKIATGSGPGQFGGRLTVGTGYAITSNTAINQPAILNIQTGAQLMVNAGNTLSLNTTNLPATGTGTGTIQGQNNTAIVSLGNGFNGGTIPGELFASPFAGQLVIPAGGLTQTGNLTMGATSILQMNGNLTVNPSSTLTLSGSANSLLSAGGLLNGTNTQSIVALSAGFNGGTIPANRFASPFNGALTTAGAMTLSGALTFGSPSSLALGGDMTIPAATSVYLGMTGANTLTGTGRFMAAAATSQVSLAPAFNNGILPGASFTLFGGIIAMNSSMSLANSLALGATGSLDIGGGRNTLSLGEANLSVATTIRGTTSTAFVVTNGSGGLTMNNSALSSVFFPIGTTPSTYSPLTVSNASTPDIFTVRARPGITNSAVTYPNYVNIEWLISQTGSGNRILTFVPQWASVNQQGTNFLNRAVGMGLFINNQYVETATGASATVTGGGYVSTSGTFNAAFSSTPLVVFSKVVYVPVSVMQPSISSFTPLTLPVSNDDFSITFTGINLNTVRTITAHHTTANIVVSGTVVGTPSAGLLTVSFPGIVRGISGTLRITMINTATAGSTTAEFTITPIARPTLTALAPATTASGRVFTLNLIGTGFLSQARLSVNSNPVRAMSATTATSVALEVPAVLNSTASTLRIRLTNTDGQFAELPLTVGQATRPNITAISPRAVFAGTNGVTINVEGAGFFGSGFVTARFGSTLVDVNVVSSTRLTLSVPANLLTTTGFPTILISNSDAESIGHVFSILERVPLGATPVITSYSPTSTTASNRAYSVTVTGSNFNRNALVTVRGIVVTPNALDSNRLLVEVPAGLNIAPVLLDIVLQNPDLQATTATVAVGAALPVPVLNSISPQSTSGGSSPGRPFTITISGTNFTTGSSVLLNGQSLQIASQNSTTIRAIIPTNSLQQPLLSPDGLNIIIVLNSDGQATLPVIFGIFPLNVSILDNSLPNFSAYPSPVADILTIRGSFERSSGVQISISNTLGHCVMQWSEYHAVGIYNRQVDVSSLPSGAYIVEIKDGARRMVQKILKY